MIHLSSPPRWLLAAVALATAATSACTEGTSSAAPPASSGSPAEAPLPVSSAAASAEPATAAAPAPSAKASVAPRADAPVSDPAPAPEPAGARIHSRARFAWIQPHAGSSKGWLGYLGLGSSVRLKGGSVETARMNGSDACDAWYAVEPRGFVCAGKAATIDPADPAYVAVRRERPDVSSPWPYRYGESLGTPRYATLPAAAEQRRAEWDLDEHLDKVTRARAASGDEAVAAVDRALVGVDLRPAGRGPPELLPLGPLVREARKSVALASTIAFSQEFDADGRTFLLTSDHALVPKDRVRPYPRSEFHGVALSGATRLPLAFFRKEPRPRYRRAADGSFAAEGEPFPRLGHVGLTGEEATHDSKRFLETREAGVWILAADAAIAEQATQLPFARALAEGEPPRTWVDVSVLGGTLTAYEELTPVFATMISPGRGGVPVKGVPAIETAATPVGTFRVDGKFLTATMVSSSNDSIVHADVQFVQNFHGPHSLHGAYWHDAWGELKSGGCVNLSPRDAKWLFAWTEPRMPEGWHGLRSTSDAGRATVVRVRR